MSEIIAVDAGKFMTKAVSNMGVESFKTKYYKLGDEEYVEPNGKSFLVSLCGENFIVGEQGLISDFSLEKASTVHKLCIYTAMHHLTNDSSVNLVIGCPVSLYRSKQQRKKYKDSIVGDGKFKVGVNNVYKTFLVKKTLILPEGVGAPYIYPQYFTDKRVALIDLGGQTLNFTIYSNLVPEIDSMFTRNLGSFGIESRVISELNSKFGMSLSSEEAQAAMKQRGLKIRGEIDEESTQIIESILEEHTISIIQEIRKNNINLDTLEVVCMGGTSILLSKYLKKLIPHSILLEDSAFINAKGFYKVGSLKFKDLLNDE